MINEKIKDTNEMMSEDDKKFYNFLSDLNFRINGFLKIETIIDIIKESINKSKTFSFSSRYVFIDKSKPTFSLKYTLPDEYLNKSLGDQTNYLTKKINEDIISILSEKVNKLIRENEDIKEFMNNAESFGIDLPKNFNVTNYMYSSIFGINFAQAAGMVILEYLK